MLFETRSFVAQFITSHVVSNTEAASPASFVVPAAHATQALLFETRIRSWHSTSRRIRSRGSITSIVRDPEAASPASFVVPAAHATQPLFETRSFVAQVVTSHVVSDPEALSLISFIVLAAHVTQALFETRSFKAHRS